MTAPIETIYPTGATLYAIVHHPDGRVWSVLDEDWEAYNSAHWANYAVAMTEQTPSGYYRSGYPAGAAEALTTEVIYVRVGASPAIGDAPASGIGQSQGTNIAAVGQDAGLADNLRAGLLSEIQGHAVAGTLSVRQATTDLDDTIDNVYLGRLLVWTTGALLRQSASVLGYNGTTRVLTFGPVTSAPTAGDAFIII